MVEVADDGPGFDEGGGETLFTRFVRGRNVTASGSGIGLALVAELVRAHGGTCQAGTSVLGGALVTLRLPGPTGAACTGPKAWVHATDVHPDERRVAQGVPADSRT